MLKGSIYITDNLEIVYNTPMNNLSKIISLDEDGILDANKDIIGGTCLLPPIEAKIAEADGNEQLYDMLYTDHLLMPFQQQFVAALIAFLYKGGNLILFLPELGYTNTMEKLIEHLYRTYGIHVGLIGSQNPVKANCFYDVKCIPIWLNLIFSAEVISAEEYLYMYPVDALITNEQIMNMLIDKVQPYGLTINEKRNYIYRYHRLIHKNPNVRPAIYGV
jgi:hypothetical protein